MWKHMPAAGAAALLASSAGAQEVMHSQAATMASPGTGVVRQQYHYYRFGSGPETRETTRHQLRTILSYGLARDWAAYLEAPVEWRRVEADDGRTSRDFGVDELSAMLKWRFYRDDVGGIDTRRAALYFGAAFPSGSHLSDNSVDPFVGVVYTQISGRHGFNIDAAFRLNTGGDDEHNFGGQGPDDAVFLSGAYLFRLDPPEYTAETEASIYASSEINAIYETSGDLEVRWSPGILYEGRRWAWEVMVQLPLYQDVDRRPELDVGFGAGVRLSF
jgi:hypothetical protein